MALLLAAKAQAAEPVSWLRPLAGAEVDWAGGTITARAGAAADMRMPSADAARPGAERRARAAALEKLRAALKALPLGHGAKLEEKEIEAALRRASTASVEYQSNGGVVLGARVRFEDLGGNSAPATATATATATNVPVLAVAAMGLEVGPVVVAEKEVVVWGARYRLGTAPKDALSVRRDDQGRLLLPKGVSLAPEQLAGAVVIYVQKVLP